MRGEHHAVGRGLPARLRLGAACCRSPAALRRQGPHGQPCRCMTRPAETAAREAGTLGHEQALGDGGRAEIAFLLQVRLHGV